MILAKHIIIIQTLETGDIEMRDASKDRVMPDYKRIAQECVDKLDVERELLEAHQKGYDSGFVDGSELGWINDLEDDDDWIEAWEKATLEDAIPEECDLYSYFNIKGNKNDPEEEC